MLKNYEEKKKKFASAAGNIAIKEKIAKATIAAEKAEKILQENKQEVVKEAIIATKKKRVTKPKAVVPVPVPVAVAVQEPVEEKADEFIAFLQNETKGVNEHYLLKIHTGIFMVFMEDKAGNKISKKIEAPIFIKKEDLEYLFEGFKITKFRKVDE